MDFTDLHLHSTFSLLDSFGTPHQMVERAKELGRKSIALTDHGSTSGFVQFWKACKEFEVKPIFGYEAYFVPSIEEMFETKERKKSHITILAENNIGYKNVLKLASEAYREGFYYRQTIDWKMLEKYSEGLIVLSGCWSGILQKALVLGDMEVAENIVSKAKNIFGDRYFLETQHYDLHKETFPVLYSLSKKFDIPVVLTCDVHYMKPDQAPIQEILHCVRDRRTFEQDKVISDSFQYEPEKLLNLVKGKFGGECWENIFSNVAKVADRCNVEVSQGAFPRFTSESGLNSEDELDRLCKIGIEERGLKGVGKVYKERYCYEKRVLKEKGFIDYVLITADLVRWSKNNGILVGGGRGSSSGSLICFLLGITELDPIKYDLLFERFFDETRTDPPDIDTDFESEKRSLVKDYVSQKYGEDMVCEVATFAKFKGKNSLDEIGKIFGIPKTSVNTVKKYLVERSGGDMRSQLTIEDTFLMSEEAKNVSEQYPDISKAALLEGQLRHMSIHAAGIIIGNEPIENIVAVYQKDDRKVSAMEMKDAAYLGLIKMDFLGLKELSILRKVAEKVGMSISDIYSIPLDDIETLKGFKEIDVEGVFQYNGDSTKSVLRQMPIIDFEQLAACLSLSKPGSSHSGGTTSYLARMRGDSSIPGFDWHPILAKITRKTYGQIIYQEQIISILREFANFSVTDANTCRRIVSKSVGEQEFDKYYPKFLEGASDKGTPEQLKKIWDNLKVFGRFVFNKSHATAYALLAFWSMYMKRHYPLQFFLIELDYITSDGEKYRILMDASKRGFKVAPPCLGKSRLEWSIENDDTLRAGLMEIKGVGQKTAEKILECGLINRSDFEGKIKGVNVGIKKKFEEYHTYADMEPLKDFFGIGRFDILDKLVPDRQKLKDIRDWDKSYNLKVAGVFAELNYKDVFEEKKSRGHSTDRIKSPEKAKYAMLLLEDETDRCLVHIDRFFWDQIGQDIWDAYNNGKIVVIEGLKVAGWRMIRAKKVSVCEETINATENKSEDIDEEVLEHV